MNKIIRYPLKNKKRVNSGFGPRSSGDKFHDGIDLDNDYTPETIFNIYDGFVIKARIIDMDSYGKYVTVWYPELKIMAMYAHMSHVNVVEGQKVPIGYELGMTGMTGNTTGPHLHFEIRECAPDDFWDKEKSNVYKYCVDPKIYLDQIPDDIIGHWNQTNLVKAINDGIIQGDDKGNINPDGYMTKAETIQIVYNIS